MKTLKIVVEYQTKEVKTEDMYNSGLHERVFFCEYRIRSDLIDAVSRMIQEIDGLREAYIKNIKIEVIDGEII